METGDYSHIVLLQVVKPGTSIIRRQSVRDLEYLKTRGVPIQRVGTQAFS